MLLRFPDDADDDVFVDLLVCVVVPDVLEDDVVIIGCCCALLAVFAGVARLFFAVVADEGRRTLLYVLDMDDVNMACSAGDARVGPDRLFVG